MLSTLARLCVPAYGTEIVPTRTNHLDLRAWLNANYNENDTREWLREFTAVSTHPNINLQCRQPGAINLMRIFRNVPGFLASNMSVREVAEMMYMEGNEVIRESYVSMCALHSALHCTACVCRHVQRASQHACTLPCLALCYPVQYCTVRHCTQAVARVTQM